MSQSLREIPGPAGPLEVLMDLPAGPPRAAVVFAHPLPIQGGTMHTKVVFQGAKALTRIGCAVLRFNFRGAGASDGTFSNGPGEQDDFRAALTYMREQYPGLPLVAAGFSFGARVSLEGSCSDPRVERVLAAGVPAGSGDYGFLARCSRAKHFLHSTNDQYGSREQMEAVYGLAAEPKELRWIEASDHFFQGGLDQLEEAVRVILASRASSSTTASST